MLYSFLYSYRTMFMCLCGLVIFFPKQPKRRRWVIYLTASIVVYAVFIFCYSYFFDNFFGSKNIFLSCSTYLIQYVLITVIAYLCLDYNIISALFCSTTAYSIEQLISRICGLIGTAYAGTTYALWLDLMTTLLVGGVICIAVYFIFLWREGARNSEIQVQKPIQLVIAVLVVAVMIFIEQAITIGKVHTDKQWVNVLNYFSSIIFAFVILVLEYNTLSRQEVIQENKMIKRIMAQEREQFEFKKSVIDTINIKAHDLKHQLTALNGKILPDELKKIEDAVQSYDISKKSGNKALDVVLNTQSMFCESNGIEFTCMADGKILNFMSDSDIYSLFNNILDNAVEAVMKVADKEKRAIALTVTAKDGFVFIREENYCTGSIIFKNGLPQTTKGDNVYHGFGVKSIRTTAENYGGHCSVNLDGEIFSIDVMLPLHM